MCLTDTIDWPSVFLGTIHAGRGRGAGQHVDDRGRLPLHAGGHPARGCWWSRRRCCRNSRSSLPALPDFHLIVSGSHEELPHQDLDRLIEACRAPMPSPRRRPATTSRSGSTPRARPASRRRRCMCTPTSADQRSLCRADPRHHRERRLLLGGEAVLRLWARQRDDVSAVGRRDHRAAAGPADAGRRRGAAAPASGHGVLCGADLLCRVPGESRRRRRATS